MTARSDTDEDDMPDASELLDFELIAKSQPEGGRGLWLWVVLIVVLGGVGVGGWLSLQGETPKTLSGEGVPIILAPKAKLKERPADPGGMKVPDRDKLVYGRMTGKVEAVGGVERLLPPPEMPLKPPQKAPQAPKTEPQTAASAKTDRAKTRKAGMPTLLEAPLRAPKALKRVPPSKSAPRSLSVTQKPQPKPKTKIRGMAKAGQGYLIQLSAVRTEQAAKFEWARLAKKHADILGSVEAVIQRANLGTKGIFYRVRGGWFAKRAQAKAVCEELVRRNVGCIIVRP